MLDYWLDCHQLPPVGMTVISDLKSIPKIHTSDFQGLLSFKDFLNSTESGTRSCTVVMNDVIRQRDPLLKSVLNNIRYGTMDEPSVDFLLRRCLDNLSEDEKLQFQIEALYLMPTWEMTRGITLKYLKILPGPYAIIKPNYDSCSRSNKNHCIS